MTVTTKWKKAKRIIAISLFVYGLGYTELNMHESQPDSPIPEVSVIQLRALEKDVRNLWYQGAFTDEQLEEDLQLTFDKAGWDGKSQAEILARMTTLQGYIDAFRVLGIQGGENPG